MRLQGTQKRRGRRVGQKRGVALVMVLGALAVLAVMLTEFQDETSADFGHALSERDGIKAEYAARSAINLSRLLIAAEPTVRRNIALITGGAQIPVWEFADSILGAFNDKAGQERFQSLGRFSFEEGTNLGLEGAGFEVVIVDEDSKLNFNAGATGNAFAQQRLGAQLRGLVAGLQYNPLFDERDSEGQFTNRQQLCSAIVDWTDPDQDNFPCEDTGRAVTTGTEDSYYQLLKDPYERKNAAFDSLQELHLVRGMSDDIWAKFIEPRPNDPHSRVVTVWGQAKVNVNTANAQVILALICSAAVPETPLCGAGAEGDVERLKFLSVVGLLRAMTAGLPLSRSPKQFVNGLAGKGKGPGIGMLMEVLKMEPIEFRSLDQLTKAVDVKSKVFSIYATGRAQSGTRQTIRRIHAVVDFRGVPKPPNVGDLLKQAGLNADSNPSELRQAANQSNETKNLPDSATDDTIANAFRPSPGGNIIYYRID